MSNWKIKEWIKSRVSVKGATLVEMGLLLSLLAVMGIGGVYALGTKTEDVFCTAEGSIREALWGDGDCLDETAKQRLASVANGGRDEDGKLTAFLPDLEFEDVSYPIGTRGPQWVMVEKTGNYYDPMIFSISPTEGLSFGACIQEESSGQISCEPLYEALTTKNVEAGDYALGYQVEMPGDITRDVAQDLLIELYVENKPEDYVSWDITVSRPGDPNAIGIGVAFEDLVLDPGEQSRRWSSEVDENGSGPYTLTAVSANGAEVEACVYTSSWNCATEVVVTNPAAIDRIGFNINTVPMGSRWIALEDEVTITATLNSTPSVTESWDIGVTRPEYLIVFEPNMSFDDYTTANEATANSQFRVPGGEWNTPGILTVSNEDGYTVEVCHRTSVHYPADCGESLTVGMSGETGFRIEFTGSTVYEDIETDVVLTMTPPEFPELAKTWTITVMRPGREATFDPDFSFADYTTPNEAGTTTQSRTVGGDWNTPGVITATNADGYSVKLCYKASVNYPGSCQDPGQNLALKKTGTTSFVMNFTGASVYDTIVTDVVLTAQATDFPDMSKTWTVQVTRPGRQIEFNPDLSMSTVTFADGAQMGQSLRIPGGNWNLPIEITASSSGGFPVQVCYGSGSVSCGNSYTLSANATTPVGFGIDFSSGDEEQEYSTSVVLTATAVGHPEHTQSWTVNVVREEKEPIPDPPSQPEGSTFGPYPNDHEPWLNNEFAAGSTGEQLYLVPVQHIYPGTTSISRVYTNSMNNSGGVSLKPCYRMVQGGPVTCGSYNSGVTYTPVSGLPYEIGYTASLPANTSTTINVEKAFSIWVSETVRQFSIRRAGQ